MGTVSDRDADDQVGLVGRLGPDKVVEALSLIKTGRIYDLESARWHDMPVARGHPPFQLLSYRTAPGERNQKDMPLLLENNDVGFCFNTELMIATMHSGTHVDALSHICCGADAEWYGGHSAYTDLGDFGALSCDASSIPPVITRGVLIDVASHLGVSALPKGYAISADEVRATLDSQGLEIRQDDVPLVRTGYMSVWPSTRAAEHLGAGIDFDVAVYLADCGAIMIAGDTESLEVLPSTDATNPHPVHIELLIRRGIHIMEMVNMEELAADKVYEFCFVSLPLRVQGATGSMVRPIALV
jgi:kynurenine formamidase